MTIEIRTRSNRNFRAALAYVQRHYADQFATVDRVSFVSPELDQSRVHGRCFQLFDITVGVGMHRRMVPNGRSAIRIVNGRRTVAEFVGTLVHELTHARQFAERRQATEPEAYAAGHAARSRYQESQG